ncbi:MAG: polyphosphate kinase 2 family protein, partial [Angustibacter sp.]
MAAAKSGIEIRDPAEFSALVRIQPGFVLAELHPRSTPGRLSRPSTREHRVAAEELAGAQERLYAQGRAQGRAAILLVLQGMDTSGKGGITRHVVGLVDPQGVRLTAFKAPTATERAHSFLWRIRRALPPPGYLGVFDRSHYEDVLIARVHDLVPQAQWESRYEKINDFERRIVDSGTPVVKVLLQISRAEQYRRLAQRLARPDKHWKYNPGDITERG